MLLPLLGCEDSPLNCMFWGLALQRSGASVKLADTLQALLVAVHCQSRTRRGAKREKRAQILGLLKS